MAVYILKYVHYIKSLELTFAEEARRHWQMALFN
jgi:hypothetical protein